MKYVLLAIVILLSGFTIVVKVAFPGIEQGSWIREWPFGLWTSVAPVFVVFAIAASSRKK